MTDLEHLHNRLTDNPTKETALDIIDIIENSNSYNSNNIRISIGSIFTEIAEMDFADDKLIKRLYTILKENYELNVTSGSNILNNGSKKLFDSIWGNDNKYGKWINIWYSDHADEKQLEDFWNNVIKGAKGVDKNWLSTVKNSFFRHPNAPSKILNRQLKNRESLLNLALNPKLSGKAFQAVCDYAKVQRHDGIFENLTRNKSLKWADIANGIDLIHQLKTVFGGSVKMASERREFAIVDFIRRDDAPEKAKTLLFEMTGNEEFAPQAVKDMFIF